MINYVYQLVQPYTLSVNLQNVIFDKNVVVRPKYMSICHADQRYYRGEREAKVLRRKLPMALIHECCGTIVYDGTSTYKVGQKVVLIPNVPPKNIRHGIYENYEENSKFLSSGFDGFMRELVNLPVDRVVPFDEIEFKIASISEFFSVAIHAISRFDKIAHDYREKIGIWGDGSLGFVLACALKYKFPNSEIYVIGKTNVKLEQFYFINGVYLADDIPKNFKIDHAFECAGGQGSYYAIDDIIKYIRPQGTVMLLGVSENKVPINTRNVLEKGLSIIGVSRSGRSDFLETVELLKNRDLQAKLNSIIFEDDPVSSVSDIHRAFKTDATTSFKTVFKWNL